MNVRNLLSWLLFIFGEAIIITAFILFRGNTPDDILTMNIIVSSLVYGLFFFNYGTPWIDLKDKSQKQVGAMGINWFAAFSYAIFAIGVIVISSFVYELSFTVQLIIHCVLLFFLLLSLLFSRISAGKVQEVYQQEVKNRGGINEMKVAINSLKDKMNELSDIPESFTQRINALEENVRFISPANNNEAYDLERSFAKTVNDIKFAISDFSMNEERIESNLNKIERIYQNRNNIYSN